MFSAGPVTAKYRRLVAETIIHCGKEERIKANEGGEMRRAGVCILMQTSVWNSLVVRKKWGKMLGGKVLVKADAEGKKNKD